MTPAHQEPGAGSREQGAGSREQGAGSRKQEAGSRKQEAGSRKQERDSVTAGKCRGITEQLKMFHHGWVGIPPGG
ncbi:hypothetical protein EHW64_12085 [Erwinia psidii]|nr:hypothetical protein [Erwinia psidii]